jgi:hypothetical protein
MTAQPSSNENMLRVLATFRIFERRLRQWIKGVLDGVLGKNWWFVRGDNDDWPVSGEGRDDLIDIRERAKYAFGEAERVLGSLPETYSIDLYDYLEFSDYASIILDTWDGLEEAWSLPSPDYAEFCLVYLNFQ